MGRITCRAKMQGIVKRRGKPTIEFYKNEKPQYYCYGYIDSMTDELLEVCENCSDHVNKADEDLDKWKCYEKLNKVRKEYPKTFEWVRGKARGEHMTLFDVVINWETIVNEMMDKEDKEREVEKDV